MYLDRPIIEFHLDDLFLVRLPGLSTCPPFLGMKISTHLPGLGTPTPNGDEEIRDEMTI